MFNSVILLCVSLSVKSGLAEKKHTLQLNFNHYHYNFNEQVFSPLKSNETNWLSGYSIIYDFLSFSQKINFRISTEYSDSKTKYDGTTQNYLPVTFDSPNKFYTFQINAGYVKKLEKKNFYVIPILGLDYHLWSRGDAKLNWDYMSHKTKYSWLTSVIGFRTIYMQNRYELGFNVTFKYLLSGKVQFIYSELIESYNDPKAKLESGSGVVFQFPIKFRLRGNFSLKILPWFLFSKSGKSNVVELYSLHILMRRIYEPKSTTKIYGIRFGLGVAF